MQYYQDSSEGKGLTGVFTDELLLQGKEETVKGGLCFAYYPAPEHYMQTVNLLHPQELKYYKSLNYEKRIKDYLIGRYCAKLAVSSFVGEKNLRNILIRQGIFNQPVVTCLHVQNIQVSITHSENFAGAIAFPETHPMGIDIEKIFFGKNVALREHVSDKEEGLIKPLYYSYSERLTIIWTIKEALSKIMKTGLTAPFHIFEISDVEPGNGYMISYFRNFGQYKAISFSAGCYICSVIYPKNTEININIPALRAMLSGTLIR